VSVLHLVSHTHWDREWYRTFQQFRLRLVSLIDGLLDLLEHNPNFKHFMLDGQAIVLDDYLQMRPENEEKLRRCVQDGRLLIGPWYVLSDEFLVSPEATIRNLLEGERVCRRFGPKMRVGYIPDPFGHIGQMPQILQGFGIQAACVQRGLSDEPCELWWQAPDGARVFMAYLRDGYGNAAGLPTTDPACFIADIKRLRDSLLPHSLSKKHLLLMHGTDHMEPRDISKAIMAALGNLDGDELIHSTLPDYLAAVQATVDGETLPVIRGELRSCKRHHLLPGVLSTRMWIKQRNRACETLLEKWAEPFSTFASFMAVDRVSQAIVRCPASILREAWRLLMQCHPHDSICGCSIDQVHEEMKPRFDQVEQIGEEITRQRLEALAGAIHTGDGSSAAGDQLSIVVFNPSPFRRTDVVEVEVESERPLDLFDERGNLVPCQIQGLGARELIHIQMTPKQLQDMLSNVHDGRVMGMSILGLKAQQQGEAVYLTATVSETRPPNLEAWRRALAEINALASNPAVRTFRVRATSPDTTRLAFSALDVPGLGWKTYYLRPRSGETAPAHLPPLARLLLPLAKLPFVQRLAAPSNKARPRARIENDLLMAEVAGDGTITVTDKISGAVYRGLNRFVDSGDCGDEYNYAPPRTDRITVARLRDVTLARGPVRQTLTLHLALTTPASLAPDRQSRSKEMTVIPITSHVTLAEGVARVDIHTIVENTARDHRLRVHFPAPFTAGHAEHDGHFEIVKRPVGIPPFDESWIEQPRPEVPQRSFTSISDGRARLTVANRGLPEVEVLKNALGHAEIALTLLRCVGWLSREGFSTRQGHAGPSMEAPAAQMLGTWAFDYSIILERDAFRSYRQAYAFEAPLRAIVTDGHDGLLPAQGAFVEVTPAEFMVSAIKTAEDGRGWLVRGYNLTGQDITVTLRPWRPFTRVERVNLAEEKVAELEPAEDGTVIFPVRGYEIASIMFLGAARPGSLS